MNSLSGGEGPNFTPSTVTLPQGVMPNLSVLGFAAVETASAVAGLTTGDVGGFAPGSVVTGVVVALAMALAGLSVVGATAVVAPGGLVVGGAAAEFGAALFAASVEAVVGIDSARFAGAVMAGDAIGALAGLVTTSDAINTKTMVARTAPVQRSFVRSCINGTAIGSPAPSAVALASNAGTRARGLVAAARSAMPALA